MTQLCPESRLEHITGTMGTDPEAALAELAAELEAYPDDARLHFLQGSALIGLKRYVSGHDALARAVELAPDFAIARFQLGLFQLTSEEVDRALATLGPLDRLPDGHYLRAFVSGLRCLIRDEFDQALTHLRHGITQNAENAPLNADMEMLVSNIEETRSQAPQIDTAYEDASADKDGEAGLSEAALLLNRSRFKPNRH